MDGGRQTPLVHLNANGPYLLLKPFTIDDENIDKMLDKNEGKRVTEDTPLSRLGKISVSLTLRLVTSVTEVCVS